MSRNAVVTVLLVSLLFIGSFQLESHGMDRGNSPSTSTAKTLTYGAMKVSNDTGKEMTSIKIRPAGTSSWDLDLISLASFTGLKNGKSYTWNSMVTGNKDITFNFSDRTTKTYFNGFHVATAQMPDMSISSTGLKVAYVSAMTSSSGLPYGYTCSSSYTTTCSSCTILTCECNTIDCSDGYYDAGGLRYPFNKRNPTSVYNAVQQATTQCCK